MELINTYLPTTLSKIILEYSQEVLAFATSKAEITTFILVKTFTNANITSMRIMTLQRYKLIEAFINFTLENYLAIDYEYSNDVISDNGYMVMNTNLSMTTDDKEIDAYRILSNKLNNNFDLFDIIEEHIISSTIYMKDYLINDKDHLNVLEILMLIHDVIPLAKEDAKLLGHKYEELIDFYVNELLESIIPYLNNLPNKTGYYNYDIFLDLLYDLSKYIKK